MSLNGKLTVDFWDVGQGDASVITLPSGELILIDVGEDSCLETWLRRRNPKIKAIIVTHNDSDHCGSLNSILTAYAGPVLELWIVNDQHKRTATLTELFAAIPRYVKSGKILSRVFSVPDGIARIPIFHDPSGQIRLDAVFPSASALIGARALANPKPNTLSAILVLTIDEQIAVVWAGDAPMSAVAKTCSGLNPEILVGPHHGGPLDRPGPKDSEAAGKEYRDSFAAITPRTVFVSVGTKNGDSHPVKKDFIDLHKALGRRIVCSQLHHCGRLQMASNKPLMANHLVLGLEPPKRPGVACRGPMQVVWENSTVTYDIFHEEHAQSVQSLTPAYCVN